jgi:molecular chaperone HtpG
MTSEASAKTHKFEAEVSQVLSLVINSLYSNKDVYLRELVSNAADALDKLRFETIQNPGLVQAGYQPKIQLIPDEKAKTLTISDNGIGMSEAALIKDLGTVARSGSKELVERLKQANEKHDLKLIGQFGVGFYSGYLVADRIEVISRAAGSDAAHRWVSEGKDNFTIEPAERAEPGTTVILHLKPDHEDNARVIPISSHIRSSCASRVRRRTSPRSNASRPSTRRARCGCVRKRTSRKTSTTSSTNI